MHDRQHYQLVNFRRADTDQNYRRFFAVTTLAGLRVEDPAIFDATHAQIARWVREDGIDGLRVDHPDGLTDPTGYLAALRDLAGARDMAARREDPRDRARICLRPGRSTGTPATTPWPRRAVCSSIRRPSRRSTSCTASSPATAGAPANTRSRASGSWRQRSCSAELSRLARLAAEVAGRGGCPVRAAGGVPGIPLLPARRGRAPGSRPRRRAIEPSRPARRVRRPGRPARRPGRRVVRAVPAGVERGDGQGRGGHRLLPLHPLRRAERGRRRPGPLRPDAGAVPRRATASAAALPARHDHALDARHQALRGRPRAARRPGRSASAWAHTVRVLMAAAPIPDPGFGYLLWQTFAGVGFIERTRHARLRREGHA